MSSSNPAINIALAALGGQRVPLEVAAHILAVLYLEGWSAGKQAGEAAARDELMAMHDAVDDMLTKERGEEE